MPSKSLAQKHLMAGVAHNPAFARKVGIPQSVGEEFYEADQGHEMEKQKATANKLRKPRSSY